MKAFLPLIFLSLTIIFCNPSIAVAGDSGLPAASAKKLYNEGADHQLKDPYNNRRFFWAALYTNAGAIADGNVVAFDEMFNDGLDGDDALKMMNPGENFGIMCNAELLSIEARSPVQSGDTIFYSLQNLRQQSYQLRFRAVNMESAGLTAYLVDRYLKTNTFISLDSSFIDISITSDAGSAASDRFLIIFSKGRMQELNFINLSATWNIDKTVELTWKVDNERDVDHYTVERSNNGLDFTGIGTKSSIGNNGGSQSYEMKDVNANRNGNYYRINATDLYGKVKYSVVVNSGVMEDAAISIYPNPVKDRIMNIHFISQSPGTYMLRLSNKMGQVVYSNKVELTVINEVKTIKLDQIITTGTYQLSIIPATGNKITRQVMIR